MHNRIVHYNRTHSHQHIIMQRTAMNQCIMSNTHVVANNGLRFLVCGMQHSSVLYIYFISYTNAVYITSHNSVKPYTTLVAHHHITHHRTIRCQVTIIAKLR